MKELKKLVVVLLVAAFFIGMFIVCDRFADDVKEEYASGINPSLLGTGSSENGESGPVTASMLSVEKMVTDMVSEGYTASITIAAAGDILCQYTQLDMAYDSESGSFDFSDSFKYVKDLFLSADYSIATLKTTFAGAGKGYTDDLAGYCSIDGYLNSPEVLAMNMATAGISLVNTATNHALDSGLDGVRSTIRFLDDAQIDHVGTANASGVALEKTVDIEGIRVSFAGAANSLNADLSDEDAFCINLLDNYDDKKIKAFCTEISALKNSSEIVIAMLNFGEINTDTADNGQRQLAEKVAAAGADMIIGTGSRVMKPMEMIAVTENNGRTRNCPVFYGMGALLSSESYSSSGMDADISAILKIHILRSGTAAAAISSLEIIPIYANWYDYMVQPVPVCQAKDTDKYADVLDEDDMARIDHAYESLISHLTGDTGLSYNYKDYAYVIEMP